MGARIIAALLFAFASISCVESQALDNTRVDGQSGADVTQTVVDLIRDSGVFPDDNNFLRRIACVESKDGTDPNTYRAGYNGGIWQVDVTGFRDTQATASHRGLTARHDAIRTHPAFNIDWPSVTWMDLRKPLYSGLAARLKLSNIEEAIPGSANIADQARYWKQYYNTALGAGTVEKFIDEANMCDVCEVEAIDLAFVMDGSGSVESENFDIAKDFVRQVAAGFDIGSDNTRVGVIQYSTTFRTGIEFDFAEHMTDEALQRAIMRIGYHDGSSTQTGNAIDLMTRTLFTPSRGARDSELNIARVGVVITDGLSHDDVEGPANAARAAGITMFAIGVGGFDRDELNEIANDPQHVFTAINFGIIDNIKSIVGTAACRVPVEVEIDDDINGTLRPNSVRYASYPIPQSRMMTLKLTTPTGVGAIAYFSIRVRNPSAAFYDWKLETSRIKRFDQLFIDLTVNVVGRRRKRQSFDPLQSNLIYTTVVNKATPVDPVPGMPTPNPGDLDTSFNLIGEEGNTLIPEPTTAPQEFPCGPSTQCANNGFCRFQQGASASNYVCECSSLCYSGERCEIDNSGCTNFACQNGGQCRPIPDSCGQVYCECQSCFYGRFCETRISACANHRCENGAMCVSPMGTCRDYQCVCPGCYTGAFCDIPLPNPCDQNPCQNGGVCSPGANCYSYQCQCPDGYSGVNCEIARTTNLNLCNNFPCLNGGSCMSMHSGAYTCVCRSGWRGQDCGTPADANSMRCQFQPCQNGGTCYETYSSSNQLQGTACVCGAGFTGPQCAGSTSTNPTEDRCGMNPGLCNNGGVCYNAFIEILPGSFNTLPFCSCPVGYIGQHCEIRHYDPCGSGPCLNGGQCTSFNNYFSCQCQEGYEGTTCATRATNPCTSSPCVFGACFQSNGGTYFCQCNPGYTGPNCDIPGGTCNPNPCQNGGACTLSGTSFMCECSAGYVGNTCSTPDFDLVPPEVVGCPQNIAQVAQSGQMNVMVNWPHPVPRTPTEVQSMDQMPFSGITRLHVQVGGATMVQYSFTDYAGNTAVCAFAISASSPVGPPLRTGCPSNMIIPISSGQISQTVTWSPPTSDPGVPVYATRQPGSEFRRGTTLVTYTFGDRNGMALTVCAFLIEVRDAIDVCATRRPCQNGGQCQGSGRDFRCVCAAGYSGSLCQITPLCNPNPCQNGGTCVQPTTGGYFCTCPPGFSGVNCQQVPGQSCNNNPCFNGGTCTTTTTGFTCTCPPGFTGVNCQISAPCGSNPCMNGGLCLPTGFGYNCQCQNGYFGSNCEFGSNPCTTNPCRNGGTCIATTVSVGYICQCPSAVTGTNCENTAPCSSNPCMNGGLCSSTGFGYNCQCQSGYFGSNCEFGAPCSSNPCMNGGLCSSTGFGYNCQCQSGYFGSNCEFGAPCSSNPCMNGGLCSSTGFGYNCQCQSGYFGSNCEFGAPCSSNPCMNGGLCSSTGFGYNCQCQSGYFGSNCEFGGGPITISNCPTGVNVNDGTRTARWTMPNARDSANRPLDPVTSTFPRTQTDAYVNIGNALLVEYWYTDTSGNMDMCAFPISASAPNGPPIDSSSCPPPDLAVGTIPSPFQSTVAVSWTPPRSTQSGVISTSNRVPGALFPVGNTLVKYVFGDPRVNPSVCAFVVTVNGVPAAVGRRKKDVHSDDPYDVCRGFPCDIHRDDSTCVPCVRRYDDVFGYACVVPARFNESVDITCNEVQRPQHGHHNDESHDIGMPRDSNHQSSFQLSPAALTTIITVVVCLGILLLVIGAFIIYPVLRNSKEFQQRIFDYEAKTKYQKVSTVY